MKHLPNTPAQPSGKRRLLLSSLVGGGAVAPALNAGWSKPIVQSVLLPSHAQGSPSPQGGSVYSVTYSDGGIGSQKFTVTADGSIAGVVATASSDDAEVTGPNNDRWEITFKNRSTVTLSNVPCATKLTTGGDGVTKQTTPFASNSNLCRANYPVGVTRDTAPNYVDLVPGGLRAGDDDSYLSIQLTVNDDNVGTLGYYSNEENVVSGNVNDEDNEIIQLSIADGPEYKVNKLGGTNWNVTSSSSAVAEGETFPHGVFTLTATSVSRSDRGDGSRDVYIVEFNLGTPEQTDGDFPGPTLGVGTTLAPTQYFIPRVEASVGEPMVATTAAPTTSTTSTSTTTMAPATTMA